MNFLTKLTVSILTIACTIVSSIWLGFEKLDSRMDDKVKDGESRVLGIMKEMKNTRDQEILGIKNQFSSEVTGLKTQLSSIDGKLNILIRRSAKTEPEDNEELYTNYTSTGGNHGNSEE